MRMPFVCSTPAERQVSTLAVGHSRRFWPSMSALRDIVASGELGTILHIEGHNSNENSNNVLAGWRLSPEESPGGGLTGAGLHILDAFVSMLGPVRRVYAQLNSREQGPPPLDTAMLTLDFVNGVTGTLATVRATPFYWRVHVFGTKGSAEVLDEVTLVLRTSGNKPERITYSGDRRLARRAGRVRRCDRGETLRSRCRRRRYWRRCRHSRPHSNQWLLELRSNAAERNRSSDIATPRARVLCTSFRKTSHPQSSTETEGVRRSNQRTSDLRRHKQPFHNGSLRESPKALISRALCITLHG